MDDKMFVLGGTNENAEILKSAECFQLGISRAVWLPVPDMINRRRKFSAFVFEGKLVVAGGHIEDFEVIGDVEEFCSKNKKWSPGSILNIKRSGLGCVALYKNDGFKI